MWIGDGQRSRLENRENVTSVESLDISLGCAQETSERLNSDKKESPRFEPKKVKCFNCGVLGIVVYWGFQVPRESCADQ